MDQPSAPVAPGAPAPSPVPASPGDDPPEWMANLRRMLSQPFVGFAPWVALSLVSGPDRLVLAAAVSGGLAVILFAAGAVARLRPKVLDLCAIAFFGGLTVVAATAGAGTIRWLETWAQELANLAIAVVALASLAVRRPFTIQYAKETTEPELWSTPIFLRINDAITAVWAGALVLIAAVGAVGDGVLHQPDNTWTNWVLPIALVILAVKFTDWYPDYATETAFPPDDGRAPTHRPADLLKPLIAYLVPVGILIMIVAGQLWWIGLGVMGAGIAIMRVLGMDPSDPSGEQPAT